MLCPSYLYTVPLEVDLFSAFFAELWLDLCFADLCLELLFLFDLVFDLLLDLCLRLLFLLDLFLDLLFDLCLELLCLFSPFLLLFFSFLPFFLFRCKCKVNFRGISTSQSHTCTCDSELEVEELDDVMAQNYLLRYAIIYIYRVA